MNEFKAFEKMDPLRVESEKPVKANTNLDIKQRPVVLQDAVHPTEKTIHPYHGWYKKLKASQGHDIHQFSFRTFPSQSCFYQQSDA